jgi:hypothetical protein
VGLCVYEKIRFQKRPRSRSCMELWYIGVIDLLYLFQDVNMRSLRIARALREECMGIRQESLKFS